MQQLYLVCHLGLKNTNYRPICRASAIYGISKLRFLGTFMRNKTLWGDKINKVNIITIHVFYVPYKETNTKHKVMPKGLIETSVLRYYVYEKMDDFSDLDPNQYGKRFHIAVLHNRFCKSHNTM